MTLEGFLYTVVLVISFILIGVCTLLVMTFCTLYDLIKKHAAKCNDIKKHISDIYHNPDKKG